MHFLISEIPDSSSIAHQGRCEGSRSQRFNAQTALLECGCLEKSTKPNQNESMSNPAIEHQQNPLQFQYCKRLESEMGHSCCKALHLQVKSVTPS